MLARCWTALSWAAVGLMGTIAGCTCDPAMPAPDIAKPNPALPPPSIEHPRVMQLEAMMMLLRPLHRSAAAPKPGEWLDLHHEPGQTFAEYRASHHRDRAPQRDKIYVQPLGSTTAAERRIVTLAADFLERTFGLAVRVAPDLPLSLLPGEAKRAQPSTGTLQILTSYLLQEVLLPRLPHDAAAYVSITSRDLWPGGEFSFVFGQASLSDRVGVWSLHRFGDPGASQAAFSLALSRALKVAVHETGHMFGMKHCTAYECVMAGSNHLRETDDAPLWLCPECQAKVAWATGGEPIESFRRRAEFCERHGFAAEAEHFRSALAALGAE